MTTFKEGGFSRIIKKGTGTWTLTGTSNAWVNGNFTVDAGTVVMDGEITSTNIPAIVASEAVLSGSGTINGTTTINGTLEGSMNFGTDLNLLGTTNIQVDGFETGEFDVINVVETVNNGGVLNINLASAPTNDGSIQLIKAGTYNGTFNEVKITVSGQGNPSGAPLRAPAASTAMSYSYNESTGILTYSSTATNVNEIKSNIEVYPTLTKGDVYVNGENVEQINILNLSGQIFKNIKSKGVQTIVNLSELPNGIYFLRISYTDGTNNTKPVILQK